jgi:hypothetical protein
VQFYDFGIDTTGVVLICYAIKMAVCAFILSQASMVLMSSIRLLVSWE